MTKTFWIGGKNTVFEAIKNPKRKILTIVSSKDYEEVSNLKNKNTNYNKVKNSYFNKIFRDPSLNHQSIAAEVEDIKSDKITSDLKNINNAVMLDNITDPRNIGSIARTALSFGIDAVIVQKRHFNSTSPLMYKSASGAMEKIKFYEEVNLSNTIRLLKKNNFWINGLSAKTKNNIIEFNTFDQKNVFIFGSEGKGISKNLFSLCDNVFKINISKKMESLNVSNAVAATLAIVSLKKQIS